jgi:hypothetical protein
MRRWEAMAQIIRTADAKGRISLPKSFANATVIVERISDVEVRIRKARVVPEDEARFVEEELRAPLSDHDRDRFLAMLDNPPEPNEVLKRAFARRSKRRG